MIETLQINKNIRPKNDEKHVRDSSAQWILYRLCLSRHVCLLVWKQIFFSIGVFKTLSNISDEAFLWKKSTVTTVTIFSKILGPEYANFSVSVLLNMKAVNLTFSGDLGKLCICKF